MQIEARSIQHVESPKTTHSSFWAVEELPTTKPTQPQEILGAGGGGVPTIAMGSFSHSKRSGGIMLLVHVSGSPRSPNCVESKFDATHTIPLQREADQNAKNACPVQVLALKIWLVHPLPYLYFTNSAAAA